MSTVLSCATVIIFPSIAGSNQENENTQIAFLVVVIEIISKQFMYYISSIVNSMVKEPAALLVNSKTCIEFAKFQALWIVIQLSISLVEAILLFAMVLPVSISQLELSEWQKVLIFGFFFPAFRFILLIIQHEIYIYMLRKSVR